MSSNTPSNRFVIIGGVAAGASCAAKLRRLSEHSSITIIERSGDISIATCGMPYHLSGEIEDRDELLVMPVERFQDRYNIDVRTHTVCISIDRASKSVTVKHVQSGEVSVLPYDKLVLATGASPFVPPIEGLAAAHESGTKVLVLRDLQDMDKIREVVTEGKKVAIVGGGYIGVELAEALAQRKVQVTIVEMLPQILPPMDAEMTLPVLQELREHGVTVHLNAQCKAIENGKLILASGQSIDCDAVLLCVGVRPESKLAKDAGIEVGPRGGVAVNEHMQTNDPDVYAVGDVVEVVEVVTQTPHMQIALAGPANRQGRIAAVHMCGDATAKYRGTQGSSILRCFGKTIAATGASEKFLKSRGYDSTKLGKVIASFNSHAGYFPGATRLILKLLFEKPSGKILGAQCLGYGHEGVDKRIDVIAMAIQAGMTVHDLEEAELCYAPPFGSAKDPINMVGFIGAGILSGEQKLVFWSDNKIAERAKNGDVVLLDVRTDHEWQHGHIIGAVHLPLEKLRSEVETIRKMQQTANGMSRDVVVYCHTGMRSYMAACLLEQHGLKQVSNLAGGWELYSKLQLPSAL